MGIAGVIFIVIGLWLGALIDCAGISSYTKDRYASRGVLVMVFFVALGLICLAIHYGHLSLGR